MLERGLRCSWAERHGMEPPGLQLLCWKQGQSPLSSGASASHRDPLSSCPRPVLLAGSPGGLSTGNGSLTWAFQQLFSFCFSFPNTLSSIQKSIQPQVDHLVLPTRPLDMKRFCLCIFCTPAPQKSKPFQIPQLESLLKRSGLPCSPQSILCVLNTL